MASQRRAAQLAEAFDQSYPDGLAPRLAWLADHLRIDRARLLRLLGLAPDEVTENLHASWETIAERWGDQAGWVEELLSQLIAFFGYDWRALANRLHEPSEAGEQPEPERAFRPVGRIECLRTVPPEQREETLLARISEGGPDVLVSLLQFLRSPMNGAIPQGKK